MSTRKTVDIKIYFCQWLAVILLDKGSSFHGEAIFFKFLSNDKINQISLNHSNVFFSLVIFSNPFFIVGKNSTSVCILILRPYKIIYVDVSKAWCKKMPFFSSWRNAPGVFRWVYVARVHRARADHVTRGVHADDKSSTQFRSPAALSGPAGAA